MLKKFFQIIFLSLCFLFVVGLFFWGMQWFSRISENFFQLKLGQEQNKFLGALAAARLNASPAENLPVKDSNAKDPDINTQAAISVYADFLDSEKILYSKNEELKVPIASLTKLMTAEIVLENFTLSVNIKISKAAEAQDERRLLKAGQLFFAKDLLYDMLIESNNSAAYAFAEAMGYDNFVKAMNLKANEIGMKNTYFSSPTGLDITNYSTAKDFVMLGEYIFKNNTPVLQITQKENFDLYDSNGNFHHKAINSNDLLKDPDVAPRIAAGKTGDTKDAGQCLFLILKAPEQKGYLINVVLNADNRFAEMKKIINWADSSYQWK